MIHYELFRILLNSHLAQAHLIWIPVDWVEAPETFEFWKSHFFLVNQKEEFQKKFYSQCDQVAE